MNVAAGDAAEAVVAGRGPHLALAHDEEMRRVAGRDEAVRIEHQRFVGAGLGRLDAGGDAVELGMRVELRVLHVRIAAAHMHGEQREAALDGLRQRRLVFGDDDDGRRADRRRADPDRACA